MIELDSSRGTRRAPLVPGGSRAVAALAVLLLATACSSRGGIVGTPELDDAHEQSFDDGDGGLPAGWRADTTNPDPAQAPGRWERESDLSAPSPPNVLGLEDAAGHTGHTYNLCWTDEVRAADLELSVRVRANGGAEDQGGGPAWRIAGADDYYLARWNPLEDNFRVYSVVDGVRVELASSVVRADPAAWHTIRVRHIGHEITCWLDRDQLLEVRDDALTDPGGVGVWTKADATTRFDDFRAAPHHAPL